MGDFDDLTPRYAHTHSAAEVVEWFRDAGLVNIEPLSRATSVHARKANSGASLHASVPSERGRGPTGPMRAK